MNSDGHRTDSTVAAWQARFVTLSDRWHAVASVQSTETGDWPRRLGAMKATEQRLRQQGRWTRGPEDLMSVCGFHRRELAHSAALRWLCDPSGSHGLGTGFLSGLLAATGGVPGTTADAEPRTEVVRERSRADVVVYGADWTLVAELKVDATESAEQCQRLFEDWRTEPGVRLVFLTLSGRAPATTSTPAAARAWRRLSWAGVLDVLDEAVRTTPGNRPEASAVAEYRRALRRLVGRR